MMAKPENLPGHWEYDEKTDCVVCGGCAFRYGAEHENDLGGWTCPNCEDGNGDKFATITPALDAATSQLVLEMARAAIGEMRNPTDAMLEVGPGEPYMDDHVWAKMIDEALR